MATSDSAGCTRETVDAGDSNYFNFFFTGCRTPSVSAISFTDAVAAMPRSGTASTVLTVTGADLATNDCANIARIGGCACTVSGSTVTSLECTPDSACEYDAGIYQPITVNVNQLGSAIVDIHTVSDQSVAFVPSVDSISPDRGSMRGGTKVTITGSGFPSLEAVSVTFNGEPSECESINPLVCTSPSSTTGDVVVTVANLPSVCTGSCTFNYDSALTPSVTDVTPASVSGSTQLSLTGTGFGSDPSVVSISIGGEDCSSVSLTSATSVQCTVSAIRAGLNDIVLIVDGIGKASSSVTVTGEAVASNVDPVSGSVNGGTELTFTGHGFSGTTTVQAGGASVCDDVEVISLTELTCTTVAKAAGAVDIIITSNGESYSAIAYTFSDADTPTVTSVSPTQGGADDTVTISGSNFGSDASAISVSIGDVECTSVSIVTADTSISCTAGELGTGGYPVVVTVDGKGLSNNDQTFEYIIVVSGISPTSGDSRGNQLLTVSGSGFSDALAVTVCGEECKVESTTATDIVCATPPKGCKYFSQNYK